LGKTIATSEDDSSDWRVPLEARVSALIASERPDEARRLLHAYLGFAQRWLLRHWGEELGGVAGVEELVRAAVAEALERLGDYRPARGGLIFWTWRVALRLARERLRTVRAGGPRAAAEPGLAEAFHAALEEIPAHFAALVRIDLEYVGRAPASVLAAELGVDPNTVHEWRFLARKALKERRG
jgi:DNA-directed RNA polymerase specialized sigma24 family protein